MSWFNLAPKKSEDRRTDTGQPATPAASAVDTPMKAIWRSQPVVEFGLDGRITSANAVFCALAQVSEQEIASHPISRFYSARDSEATPDRVFWDRLARGEPQTGQLRLAGSDGKEVVLQMSYSPSLDTSGKTIRVVGTGVDITALITKAAQDAIELKLRSDIMDTTSIVSYADTKGDILSVNEKFIEVSKYNRDELIGKPHNTTRHPDMPKEVFKELWQTIGRGKMFRGIIKNRAKDGTPYYVDAVIAPIMGDNGKPKRYLGVRYDITDAEIERQNMRGLLEAVKSNYAYIEFDTAAHVLTANENFLNVLGYQLQDIVGKHHRMFVEPAFANTPAYSQLWADLIAGKAASGIFKRLTSKGNDVFIQAVYAPVKDEVGRVMKIVKIATDVTAEKLQATDFAGQLAAIGKAQAVIEFGLDGRVLHANENFCQTLGYQLSEIKGQHHSMFVDGVERSGPEYRMFWEKLGRGEYDSGQYRRIAKSGKEIWIQASYNPIMDLNGKPFKVVKYATEITAQVMASRALQQAVDDSNAVVMAAKDNDLSRRIPMEGKSGEIEALCAGVNGLIDTMASVVQSTTEVASTISTAVAEITSGTDDLSRRTESQASSLQETSASMEEIASTIRQNSENAQQANKLAADARGVATQGGEIVSRAVTAMSKIEESSGKVSDIIGVIDEIAFQTNLLALNAAVEAARAGDAGRGFAVVASEVRSLAQRSSGAAKDIKALIVQSGAQVKDGVKLVNDAGTALGEIVSSVNRVTDIVAEIASASREQSIGVEEINKAVSQMDEMTQQNSALVEENAAACRLLQEQAEDMSNRMAAFKTAAGEGAVPMVRRVARPSPSVAKPAAARPPIRKIASGARAGAAGLQANLQTAFSDEQDWKEF
ncbi:PAS domain [Rhabdaerophilaceae bacterium]